MYERAIQRIEAAGGDSPRGRQYHVCFGSGEALQVFEVWESQEDFESYGPTLMPLLQEVGIHPGQPMIEPVVRTRS